jgi:hypothetical protein
MSSPFWRPLLDVTGSGIDDREVWKKSRNQGATKPPTVGAAVVTGNSADSASAADNAGELAASADQSRPTASAVLDACETGANDARPERALDTLVMSLMSEQFYFSPSPATIDSVANARKIESVKVHDSSSDGFLLHLAGGDPSAEPGARTEGFSIRVPDDFELAASEHMIRVRALARCAGAAQTRLALAYSTCEVGNSGWRWRDIGPEWSVCEMYYSVPKMIKGFGDYIGLLPDRLGSPGVEIHSVSATVIC